MQKWVNLIIALNGRTLDIYIDGKLTKTCVLEGIAKVDKDANILVTPNGGFCGWTSNFQYWDTPTNPQQAYNIYKSGFGGSLLGDSLTNIESRSASLKIIRNKAALRSKVRVISIDNYLQCIYRYELTTTVRKSRRRFYWF